MASEKQSGKEKRLANNENTTEFKQSWCFNMVSCTRRTSIKRKSTKDDCKSNIRFDNISKAAEPQNGEVEPVKRKMPRRTKRFNMIRKTFTMCCTPDRDSSIDGDDVIRSSRNQEKNIRERNADDAYSSLENIESSSSSKRKGQTSSKNTSDWSVSSPIVRPKQLGKSCATSSPANEIKNMQIKSIYKPSNRKPSGVAVTNVTKAKQPVQNHSGEIEVKQSKAQHALDHIGEQEDSKPAVNQKRVIKHARRRTRTFAKLENEPVLVTVEPDTIKLVKNDATPKLDKQIPNVASDVKVDIPKAEEAPPIFIETEATVDYGRCAVEPSYGEKPDKKKLRTGKKEKIKTKGQPNKHLMAKKENRDFDTLMDEYLADIDNEEESNDNVENTDVKFDEEVTKAPSPVVMNAVDQPQVLDDREFHLVPDEIKRVDDPFLEDVEEHYKLSTPGSNKKEKRKQKADRKKENRSRKGGQTVLKLA